MEKLEKLNQLVEKYLRYSLFSALTAAARRKMISRADKPTCFRADVHSSETLLENIRAGSRFCWQIWTRHIQMAIVANKRQTNVPLLNPMKKAIALTQKHSAFWK